MSPTPIGAFLSAAAGVPKPEKLAEEPTAAEFGMALGLAITVPTPVPPIPVAVAPTNGGTLPEEPSPLTGTLASSEGADTARSLLLELGRALREDLVPAEPGAIPVKGFETAADDEVIVTAPERAPQQIAKALADLAKAGEPTLTVVAAELDVDRVARSMRPAPPAAAPATAPAVAPVAVPAGAPAAAPVDTVAIAASVVIATRGAVTPTIAATPPEPESHVNGAAPVTPVAPVAAVAPAARKTTHRDGDTTNESASPVRETTPLPIASPAPAVAADTAPLTTTRTTEALPRDLTAALDAASVAPRRALDQVTLPFEAGNGLEGRLRIALRGNALHATIVTPDADSAARIENAIGELHRALAERGFSDVRVAVQHGTTAAPESERSRSESGREQRAARDDERASQQQQRRPRHGRGQEG